MTVIGSLSLGLLVFFFDGAGADWPPYNILGKGWDLSTANFWDYSQVFSSQVFSSKIPRRRCFRDTHCRHSSTLMHQTFHSVASWEHSIGASFGLTGPGGYGQISASVAASFGSGSSSEWTDDRKSLLVQVTNRRQCFAMHSECLYNQSYLHPTVAKQLETLPTSSLDLHVLKKWDKSFIKRFGSHINIASEHGSELKVVSSMPKTCTDTSRCLEAAACSSVKWMDFMDAEMCMSNDECDTKAECASLGKTHCVSAGGDKGIGSSKLCGNDVTQRQLDGFLEGGTDSSGSTVINYKFVPMDKVLHHMGYQRQAEVLKKAIEYHNCHGDRFSWLRKADGQIGCKCTLDCDNGGTLDLESCTCSCKGDSLHGFHGSRCEKSYGTCQPGKGTSKFWAASQCREAGICRTWFHQYVCSNTEVCCLSENKGGCCPLGSTCACRWGDCACVHSNGTKTSPRRTQSGMSLNLINESFSSTDVFV